VNNSGYPGDKPFGTQWFNAGAITQVTNRKIYYMIDTYGGQSGSPVWRFLNGQRHGVGIHAYGGCPNSATRIVKEVFDNMLAWRNLGF
jgi:V8-like Glu-specific endopeptidase